MVPQPTEKVWVKRQIPEQYRNHDTKKIAAELAIPESIVKILSLRGISEKEDIRDFLTPSLGKLPRPHLMKGMREAVTILVQALESGKPVTVYGDFDADGVTSTAVLSQFFTELGVSLQSYIPERLSEGYGLNVEAVRQLSASNRQQYGEAGILLTADCGISDADAIEEAQKLGFTVIVTDHHRVPEKLPPADVILNPLQDDCNFPCKILAGVGVAFYLILGIRSELMSGGHWPEDEIPNLKSYMDLVAIGTVADQVPITDCNRIIVKAGLEVINQAGRVGLQKLLGVAKNNGSGVSAEDIAFRMAPRINAIGRISSAQKAVELLTTGSPERAEKLAQELDDANNIRKDIEGAIYEEAVKMVSAEIIERANALVLYKKDWHQGVLGIVASRLSDQYNRPVILLTDCDPADKGDMRKLVKGSGRSIEGIDIHQALLSCQEMLDRFGGHEGAVGLTLPQKKIESLRYQFNMAITEQLAENSYTPSIMVDIETTLDILTDKNFQSVYNSLSPFGAGNPEPVFCKTRQKLTNLRLVGKNHLRFTIMENGSSMNGIGFGFGNLVRESQNALMDLAFTLRLNSFMGQEKWELNLVDLRPSIL